MNGIPFPDIDPVAFSIGFLQIRWYSLAYLAGFLGGARYACWLIGLYPTDARPNRDDLDNLLPWLVLGVILGGRLGYVLFYNLEHYLEYPLTIPFVWEGGMSFHGGALGVVCVCIGYALKKGFSPLRLGDIIACVAPIGLFFGRLANFANAELFGRITTVPWGVQFPYGGNLPRHPSQLYEAALEGLVLFIVLLVLARRPDIRSKPGILIGIFFAGYGLARFIIEFYREPDPQIGLILEYFSLGQLLSLPMILLGAGFIAYAKKQARIEK